MSFIGGYQSDIIFAGRNLEKMLFVSANGDDLTAVKGNMNLRYQTLLGAQNAAVAGDLIYVHRGTYNENGLGKNGVDWHFEPGAIVSNNAGTPMWSLGLYPDTTNYPAGGPMPANLGIKYSVYGKGTFIKTATSSQVDHENGVLSVLAEGCDIYFECEQVRIETNGIAVTKRYVVVECYGSKIRFVGDIYAENATALQLDLLADFQMQGRIIQVAKASPRSSLPVIYLSSFAGKARINAPVSSDLAAPASGARPLIHSVSSAGFISNGSVELNGNVEGFGECINISQLAGDALQLQVRGNLKSTTQPCIRANNTGSSIIKVTGGLETGNAKAVVQAGHTLFLEGGSIKGQAGVETVIDRTGSAQLVVMPYIHGLERYLQGSANVIGTLPASGNLTLNAFIDHRYQQTQLLTGNLTVTLSFPTALRNLDQRLHPRFLFNVVIGHLGGFSITVKSTNGVTIDTITSADEGLSIEYPYWANDLFMTGNANTLRLA